jgi:hypothetical protein
MNADETHSRLYLSKKVGYVHRGDCFGVATNSSARSPSLARRVSLLASQHVFAGVPSESHVSGDADARPAEGEPDVIERMLNAGFDRS